MFSVVGIRYEMEAMFSRFVGLWRATVEDREERETQ